MNEVKGVGIAELVASPPSDLEVGGLNIGAY
jgi:hypothetical protein